MKKFFLPLMILFLLSGCASLPYGGGPDAIVDSGTAWTSTSGYLVTNYHVVNPSFADLESMKKNEIYVSYKGTTQKAEVVDFDIAADLCLLKVEDNSKIPPALSMAEKPVSMGQNVHTVGFPIPLLYGTFPKYLDGRISAVLRHENGAASFSNEYGLNILLLQSGFYQNEGWPESLIMTTIPAIEGVSGAPLLDEDGKVAGIVSGAVNSPKVINAGVNVLHCSFAIPTKLLTSLESRAVALHGVKPSTLPLEEMVEQMLHPEKFRLAPEDVVALVLTMTPNTPDDVKAQFRKMLSLIDKGYKAPAAE